MRIKGKPPEYLPIRDPPAGNGTIVGGMPVEFARCRGVFRQSQFARFEVYGGKDTAGMRIVDDDAGLGRETENRGNQFGFAVLVENCGYARCGQGVERDVRNIGMRPKQFLRYPPAGFFRFFEHPQDGGEVPVAGAGGQYLDSRTP